MTNPKPYIFAFAFLVALMVIFALLCRGCKREELATPAPSEQHRQRVVSVDSSETAKYRAEAVYWESQFKAMQADSAKAKQQDRAQAAKARQSARKFADSGKVEDCREALLDCQGENATKAYSLHVQESMLTAYEARKKADSAEVARINAVKDTAFAGWGKANADNAQLTEALRKEKGKRFGVGVIGGYGAGKQGLGPFVGVGISYTFKRF